MRVGQLLGAAAGTGPGSATTVALEADQAPLVSRRQLLSGLAMLGFGAAAGGAAGVAIGGLTAQPATLPTTAIPPTPAQGTTAGATHTALTLTTPRLRLEAIGQEAGKLPPLGQPLAGHGVLTDANGEAVGRFAITPLPGAAGAVQIHTFELEGGTLLGMGTVAAREGTFAVVGGTGRFQGTTGSYTTRMGSEGSGRQASVEFQFDLMGE